MALGCVRQHSIIAHAAVMWTAKGSHSVPLGPPTCCNKHNEEPLSLTQRLFVILRDSVLLCVYSSGGELPRPPGRRTVCATRLDLIAVADHVAS